MPGGTAPLRAAIMNDYEVVVAGLRAMLEPYAHRVDVVELDSRVPVISEVDVVLYDAFSHERVTTSVEALLESASAPVVLFSWNLGEELVREAEGNGIAGFVSKTAGAEELVDALERVHAGERVLGVTPGPDSEPVGGDWPGRDHGLTARESEVLALVAQGLTNAEVADRAYISLNSLKSHIRAAYRKIGAERRSQAIVWATEHGFRPDRSRTVLESAAQPR
jgi:NarL family two-component system response regulator LiaR